MVSTNCFEVFIIIFKRRDRTKKGDLKVCKVCPVYGSHYEERGHIHDGSHLP